MTFGRQMLNHVIVRDTKQTNEKWAKRGRGLGHVTYFLNFEIPLISRERLKVHNSNFAGRLIVRDTNPKNAKWVKRGRGLGHVTYFTNFWDPLNISGMAEDTKLEFCMQIDGKG